MGKAIHLKGLNGIRAIAALAVVFAHITGNLNSFGLIPSIFGSDINGNPIRLLMASYGVSLFFTLSGFLITFLLLKEKESSTRINIKNFYIRRVLRIWPIYYLILFLSFTAYFIFNVKYSANVVPFYIFFAANIPIIINTTLPFLGHFWSIGVEEQFYLFWPWIVKLNNKKLLISAMKLLISLEFLKIIFWFINLKFNIEYPIVALTASRFHIMLIGSIGAIYYFNESNLIKYITTKAVQIISWGILFLAVFNKFHISSALVDHEVIAIVTLFIILGQITRTNYIVDLDTKLLDFIGRISYGIYVTHPLIIFVTGRSFIKFRESSLLNYIFIYCFIIGITLFISFISYNLYEKKFLQLKSKYATVKSKA